MVDEERLTGKLDLLRRWYRGIQEGRFPSNPEAFAVLLDTCHADAVGLEGVRDAMAEDGQTDELIASAGDKVVRFPRGGSR